MIKFELRNKYNSTPPNSNHQILMHPSGENNTIELAVFNEHRFSFYYWLKWNKYNKSDIIPDLITFDWHQDLAYPCSIQKQELKDLDLNNLNEISFFSWCRLCSLNDDHIMSAAYLNQINDIWVVCKQTQNSNMADEKIVDFTGKQHRIRKFKTQEQLLSELQKTTIQNIFFDIDLDFFTIENSTSNDKHRFTYENTSKIKKMFSNDNEFMKWIFKRMNGFTIALEPEHTGGIMKSLKYLSLLNTILFEGNILHQDCDWKHLKRKGN